MAEQDVTTVEEIWKPIPEWEGIYEASSFGNVRSLYFGKTYMLTLRLNARGYLWVRLSINGTVRSMVAHRLVLMAFVGLPPLLKMDANHKNGIRNDNRIENLEWTTRSENKLHGFRVLGNNAARGERNGRHTKPECTARGEKSVHAKLKENDIQEIRKLHDAGVSYRGLMARFGIAKTTVAHIINRRTWKHI